MIQNLQKIKLILESGSIYEGYSFGDYKETSGEVVFNTGMVGYPETLTDPSYRGQMLVCTFPLIGNYGVPGTSLKDDVLEFFESDQIQVKALIIDDYSFEYNHWNAKKSLDTWLKEQKIPGIFGIDTRKLTKELRTQGVMLGKIIIDKEEEVAAPKNNFDDPNKRNLVAEVSIQQKKIYKKGPLKVLLVDCGVKNNIIRSFLKRDITVIRVPWNYDFSEEEYDGLFISNGPGDPKHCKETIDHIKAALKEEKPVFGICLGNQLLSLAAGADTFKLKYGHRSQNQPCLEVGTKRCYITSQNHGYAVDRDTLPDEWELWFINLNDETTEGIKHKTKPFFSVQFHPEATPGPVDTDFLFDTFVEEMKNAK